jgi:adenylate cyclase
MHERFQREITVMFADIVYSSEFCRSSGNEECGSPIRRHHELLGSIVAQHGGRVLRAPGEGIMAAFGNPSDAARAAMAIQHLVAAENQSKTVTEHIGIKVAIHHGLGVVEEGDAYGEMISTLARICALTRKGDVLISQACMDHVKDESNIYCDDFGRGRFMGQAALLNVYRVTCRSGPTG